VKQQWQVDRTFNPDPDNKHMEKVIANWKKAVERSKNWYDSHVD
jgi:glycerol kinase